MPAEVAVGSFANVELRCRTDQNDRLASSVEISNDFAASLSPTSCRTNSKRSTRFEPPHFRSFPRLLTRKFVACLLVLISELIPTCEAIRCYCTDDHCVPAYGVCEASVCLVGLRRPDLTVIRTCGEEPLGCQRNVGNWVDVCSCSTQFCNTFSFLRESTQHADDGGAIPFAQPDGPPMGRRGDDLDAQRAAQHQLLMDEDTRVFQRVDGPPGEYIDEMGVRHRAPLSTRSSLLTLLLVIVPVSVGAATVLVIMFNYYCHLC